MSEHDPPCNCTEVRSIQTTSLIPQRWMQSQSHCPAVLCRCGKRYYSFAAKAAFSAREVNTDA